MKETTICLNMIVKNEAPRIARALRSVLPYIDTYCITDTGSTDDTVEAIYAFFRDTKLKGLVDEVEWKGFGHARTHNLDRSKQLCPADYHMIIDADEELYNFHPDMIQGQIPIYQAHLNNVAGQTVGPRLLLLRSDLDWTFERRIHNNPVSRVTGPDTVHEGTLLPSVIHHHEDSDTWQDRTRKFLVQAAELQREVAENPDDSRSQFYLAQAYKQAGELELAVAAFEKVTRMNGDPQEQYWAHLWPALHKGDSGKILGCVQSRPQRPDPWFYWGETMYRQKAFHVAMHLYKNVLETHRVYRCTDTVFYDRTMIDTSRTRIAELEHILGAVKK